MKISYVIETWPPELNGVALTAARMVKDLRARGHELEVIRPRQAAWDRPSGNGLLVSGLRVPMYGGLRMGFPARSTLLQRWREKRPDVVHIATEGPLGWSACSAARHLDIPVTSDFHMNLGERGGYPGRLFAPAVRAWLRSFHNATACTFVPTREVAELLTSQGFHKVKVSGRGVDTLAYSPNFRSESLRRRWATVGPVVLYVGRLAREKNLTTLIEAFDAIRVVEPTARLVVVGEGPLRESLQQRCPDAVFTGPLQADALASHYASADMFLFPSLTETFGNVTLEAMASGIPVVAYDTAAAAVHIRNGVSGLTVPCGDEVAFFKAAIELACDENLRERLGAAARKAARLADWDSIVSGFEAALFNVTTSGSEHGAANAYAA